MSLPIGAEREPVPFDADTRMRPSFVVTERTGTNVGNAAGVREEPLGRQDALAYSEDTLATPPSAPVDYDAPYLTTPSGLGYPQSGNTAQPLLQTRRLSSSLVTGSDGFNTIDYAVAKSVSEKKRASKSSPNSLSTKAKKKNSEPTRRKVLQDEWDQVKRKSEIEKKSRMKRASNIDAMKDDVARLEQSLLRLTDQCRIAEEYNQYSHFRLPIPSRLLKLRELLASQFQQSVQLRNEQFQLYQRLQHFLDINETLHNVVSSYTFSDPAVYYLLSWWNPPSDAECVRLAEESIVKVRSFQFSKRSVTNYHAGWGLSYERSLPEGFQFTITRDISMVNVQGLAQTSWEARSTTEGASRLAGSICTVDATIVKAVNKDMVVVNRSLRFPGFTLHALYLLFRTEVDGIIYCVSRELGRSQAMSWEQATRDFPETSADKWVNIFTWSSIEKIPFDEGAVQCSSYLRQENGPDGKPETHRVQYGGWWGTSYALGVQRWLLEMLFMVIRWEALYIQPRRTPDSRLATDHDQ